MAEVRPSWAWLSLSGPTGKLWIVEAGLVESPQRGKEHSPLDVARLYFTPAIPDGGVATLPFGQAAERWISGFWNTTCTDKILRDGGAGQQDPIPCFVLLGGSEGAPSRPQGIEKAIVPEASTGKR
jgi:hypothetical protein